MEQVTTFAARLKDLIGTNSFTAFGKTVGLSKQSISAYVRGERRPKPALIKSLSLQFGITPAWLMGYDAPKEMKKPVAVITETDLRPDQQQLIDAIPNLTTEQTAAVLNLISLFSE